MTDHIRSAKANLLNGPNGNRVSRGTARGSSKKKRRCKEKDLSELVREFANEKISVTSGGKRL
ncbi:hypothetical protein [Sphingobium tyrosinilyticum]|uniref:hypothetical protein n=1 Tax=Sphingobium tyrosinilyticum TaxID=2715436 RepID=UPI0036D41485